jgi:transposase-like protein
VARNEAKYESAAVAIASGKSVGETAKALGISQRTLVRWRAEASFQEKVSSIKKDLFGQTSGRLTDLSVTASNVLSDLLASEGKSRLRLEVAKAVIMLAVRLKESVERLAALEAKLNASIGTNPTN